MSELTATNTVTYDAVFVERGGLKVHTKTHVGERYRGWIIDQEPGSNEWRVVSDPGGQVLTWFDVLDTLDTLTTARKLVDILIEGGFEVQPGDARDGTQTYKLPGMDAALLHALRARAIRETEQEMSNE